VDDDFDSIRVVNRHDAQRLCNLSPRTWERLEAIGDVPPKTRLSEGRVDYRVSDIKEWLDRHREGNRGGIAKNTLSPGNALGQIKPRRRLRGLLLQSLRRQWLRLSRGAIRLQFFSIEVVEDRQ